MNYVFPPAPVVAVPVAGSDLAFPVRHVYCVGRNYVEHAQEMGFTGREPPFFFMKPADALVVVPEGAVGEIVYPPGTKNLHHEIEMVVAIGQRGHDIAAADAARHVFGYAVGLDMTRRDLQNEAKKQGRPWEIGKAFESSAPSTPLVLASEIGHPSKGAIWLDVNGKRRQSGDLNQMIWDIPGQIAFISSLFELQPGDVIMTGTPSGVGAVVKGDRLHGHVDGVGDLQVEVV